jgi:hypothetical protein
MSSTAVEIINITPTSRLVVEYDTDATNPREDYAATGALTVSAPRNTIDVLPVYDFPGELGRAFDELPSGRYVRGEEDSIIRWARLFHQITLIWDQELGTYWWTDPAFMAENHPTLTAGSPEYVAMEHDVIESDLTTYKTWANGDVYGVILERSAEWLKLDGSEDTRTEWEQEDSLFGCYIDGSYTAQQVASEHFDLTDDERAALTTDPAKEASPTQ